MLAVKLINPVVMYILRYLMLGFSAYKCMGRWIKSSFMPCINKSTFNSLLKHLNYKVLL